MLSQPLLQIKVIDTLRYRRIYEEVMKKLDKLENEFLPQVSVDKLEIVFDRVRFLEPQNRFLSIANTGQVPVQFEFIKKLNDTSYCKPWLNIQPYSDFLKPGLGNSKLTVMLCSCFIRTLQKGFVQHRRFGCHFFWEVARTLR